MTTTKKPFIDPFTADDLAIFTQSQQSRRMLGYSLCDMCAGDAHLQHAWRTWPGAQSAIRAAGVREPDAPVAPRRLREIAQEIRQNWAHVNYAAQPYLAAMAQLDNVDQAYGYDDARSIVRYFLSNARSWRGDAARKIKAELREML